MENETMVTVSDTDIVLSMDIVLAIVQILTLIALIIYVIKTWEIASASKKSTKVSERILNEMKESRDQEVAPYVVAYFDIPYGGTSIYLVVKNIGKSVAENIKLEFQPPLETSIITTNDWNINDTPLIKDGIGSMPPGYELRTFFDSSVSYLKKESKFPLIYNVNVSYSGGLRSGTRNIEQIMDLSAFSGLLPTHDENRVNDFAEKIKKSIYTDNIVQKLKEVADNLANGVWIKNPVFSMTDLQLEPELWESIVLAKLIEFKTLWTSVYGRENEKLVNPFLTDLKNKSDSIGSQILIIASSTPPNITSELTDNLVEIAVKLSELGRARVYIGVDKSVSAFEALGDCVTNLIDETIEQIKVRRAASDNSG